MNYSSQIKKLWLAVSCFTERAIPFSTPKAGSRPDLKGKTVYKVKNEASTFSLATFLSEIIISTTRTYLECFLK